MSQSNNAQMVEEKKEEEDCSQGRSQSRSQGRPQDRSENRSQSRSQGRPQGRSQGRYPFSGRYHSPSSSRDRSRSRILIQDRTIRKHLVLNHTHRYPRANFANRVPDNYFSSIANRGSNSVALPQAVRNGPASAGSGDGGSGDGGSSAQFAVHPPPHALASEASPPHAPPRAPPSEASPPHAPPSQLVPINEEGAEEDIFNPSQKHLIKRY
uniref:Uncharacterized protein n=1 Tax=Panagrolaimus superbus TaxID=310955 RepID=A0A914XU12_9BILA